MPTLLVYRQVGSEVGMETQLLDATRRRGQGDIMENSAWVYASSRRSKNIKMDIGYRRMNNEALSTALQSLKKTT